MNDIDKEHLKGLLLPVGFLDKSALDKLIKIDDIKKIIRKSNLFEADKLNNALINYEEKENLTVLENELDKLYFNEMLTFISNIPKQGKVFKSHILLEIDILNIKTILKFKLAKTQDDFLESMVFFSGLLLNQKINLALLVGKDALKYLGATKCGALAVKLLLVGALDI